MRTYEINGMVADSSYSRILYLSDLDIDSSDDAALAWLGIRTMNPYQALKERFEVAGTIALPQDLTEEDILLLYSALQEVLDES